MTIIIKKSATCLVALSIVLMVGRSIGAVTQPTLPSTALRDMFLAPNETALQKLLPVLQTAPAGALISVGTERAFMTAANTPTVDTLVIVDRSEAVLTYNRINILLLKIAKTREHYLQLRLNPNESDWAMAAQDADLPTDAQHFLLSYVGSWKIRVARHYFFNNFHRRPDSARSPFARVNYLYDDTLFKQIQALARSGRIQLYQFDLENQTKVTELVERLRGNGISLSILDISNRWQTQYISREGLAALLSHFSEITTDQSLLVTTDQPLIGPFRYTAYSYGQIRKYPSFDTFSRKLQRISYWPRTLQTRVNPVGFIERCNGILRKPI